MASKREAQLLARVRAIVEDVADRHDVEPLDIELRGQGPHRVLRVVADTASVDPAAALDVDDIATLSRRIGEALDAQDVVPGSYTLEVSSPGADRPLRTRRDFARNVGRTVTVWLATADDDVDDEVTGELLTSDDAGIVLRVDGDERTLALDGIDHGKVVLPW